MKVLTRLKAALKARGYRRGLWLSYRATRPWGLWLCGLTLFQKAEEKQNALMIRRFLAEIGLPANQVKTMVGRTLHLRRWAERLNHIFWHSRLPAHRIHGLEHLRQAQAGGHGVILASHHMLFNWLLDHLLIKEGFPQMYLVSGWSRRLSKYERKSLANILKSAQDIKKAGSTLANGGLVWILPDGLKGSRPVVASLCGCQRDFQPTFAELALRHAAPILPVSLILDRTGHLQLRIKPPLTVPKGEPAAQISSLVAQYAAFLEHAWREYPDNLPYLQMTRRLAGFVYRTAAD